MELPWVNSIAMCRVLYCLHIMPRNLTDIRPKSQTYLPPMDTDFEEKALVAEISFKGHDKVQLTVPQTSSIRHLFTNTKSLATIFFRDSPRPRVMFMLTFGSAGSGTSINAHFDGINNILAHWGSAYRLEQVAFTGLAGAEHVNIPSIIG
ncbi:hypothetical protein DPMN_063184 [Dreissena polymorpha]|uniref:Uncharacterized protein n=1 Tax=Dreissena polymorpha TaxID=45954 RepID=A0A9D4HIU6_DREPO|nr:hypothetical protein DPMN_063184 [Dreissena polymorpha]